MILKRICLLVIVFFTILISQNQAYAQLTEGLLLDYQLNGNFLDSSPNSFHGTGYNATFVDDNSGSSQGAINANGVNTYVEFPNTPDLKPDFPISMAARVKFDFLGGTQIIAATDFGVTTHSGAWIQTSSAGKLTAAYGNANGGFNGSTLHYKYVFYPLQVDTWYFVLAIIRGYQDIDIYIDCELQSGTYSGNAQTIGYTNASGSLCRKRGSPESVTPPYYFSGDIDYFSYWDRELDPEEIVPLCNISNCPGILDAQDNQGCIATDLSYNFELSGESDNIVNVLWTFADGSTSSEISPTKSYSSVGSFSFALQITMSNGCVYESDGITEIVDVPENPILPDNISICEGESYWLDFSGFTEWGQIIDPDGNPVTSYSFYESGIFDFNFIHPCGQTEVLIEVYQVNIPENPILPDSISICEGESYWLDFSGFTEWDQIIDQDGNPVTSYSFDEPGVFNFNFIDDCGQVEKSLVVIQTNTTGYLTYNGQNPICENSVASISINEWQDIQDSVSLFLDFGNGNGQIVSNESTNNLYSDSGTYMVELYGTVLNCEVNESLMLIVEAPINLDLDSLYEICEGDFVSINFDAINFPVYDSNGSPTVIFNSDTSGIYQFSSENSCGVFSEQIEILVSPFQPNPLVQQIEICPIRDTVSIGFGSDTYMYIWDTGQNTPTIFVSSGGSYSVIVSDSLGFCSDEFDFIVTQIPILVSPIFDMPEIELCEEGNTILIPNYLGFLYTFPDGSIDTSYSVQKPGDILVSFSDGCYEYEESIQVVIEKCLCPLTIPNIFTPNGDGRNEIFIPAYNCDTPIYNISIFNRWGQIMFESDNIDVGWNGQVMNTQKESSDGVYFYLVTYAQYVDDVPYFKTRKGTVMLSR